MKPPIPDNTDKRGSDLIADQSSRRASKDPSTFTFNGPDPDNDPFESSSPPEFPTLSGVNNVGPTLDLGSVKLESYIQDAVSSQLKKVSINGFTPEISGNGLSYNLPISPKASELFSILNPPPGKFMTAEGGSIGAPRFFAPDSSFNQASFNTSISREPFKFSPPSSQFEDAKSSAFKFSPPSSQTQPSFRSDLTSQHSNSSLVENLANSSPKDQLKYFNPRKKLEGESKEEFNARKKEIRELKKSDDLGHIIAAITNGDSSYFYKSFLPIYVTRADGQKKILIRLDNSHSAVIEGAGPRERTGSLPPKDSYYVAGGEVPSGPWDVSLSGIGTPNSVTGKYSSYKAIVNPGLIGGILPNNWQTEFTVGSGLSYMVVNCQTNGKVITTASISNTGSAPGQQTPGHNTAPGSFTVLFAVIRDGGAMRTVREGHIAVNPVISLSLSRPSPTPGLSVFDRYYVWGVL